MVKKTTVLEQPMVGTLVRELRRLTTLTQEQFAVMLGVNYSTINRWENGRMQPSPPALKQIKVLLEEVKETASTQQREYSQALLDHYFPNQEL